MRIGILTYAAGMNYGAQAQMLALQKYIETGGNECEIVNYRPPRLLKRNLKMSLNIEEKWYLHPRQLLYSVRRMWTFRNTIRLQKKSIAIKSGKEIDALKYDLIIIGSDEVLNFIHPFFSDIYIGKDIKHTPFLYFSPSAGALDVNYELDEERKECFGRAMFFSARDNHTMQIIKNNTSAEVERTIDPTFLYDFSAELSGCVPEVEDYILLYSFDSLEAFKDRILEYADISKKKILSVGRWYKWADICIPYASEEEWLCSFKYCNVLITDSFHGMVFAIKNEKQIILLTRSDKRNKLDNLKKDFKISLEYYTGDGSIQAYLNKNYIDYEKVHKQLETLIEKSRSYLEDGINSGKNI